METMMESYRGPFVRGDKLKYKGTCYYCNCDPIVGEVVAIQTTEQLLDTGRWSKEFAFKVRCPLCGEIGLHKIGVIESQPEIYSRKRPADRKDM